MCSEILNRFRDKKKEHFWAHSVTPLRDRLAKKMKIAYYVEHDSKHFLLNNAFQNVCRFRNK